MPFAAQSKARAPLLRDALYQVGRNVSDQTVSATLAYVDIAGLSVLVRPNASYQMDGYIAYDTNEVARCNFAVTGPPDMVSSWGSGQLTPDATGGIGSALAFRRDFMSDTSTGGYGGTGATTPGPVSAIPHGVIVTRAFGGAIQFRFAQQVSDASATTIRAGSWIRLIRIT